MSDHTEVSLRRRHGLVELGDGARFVARVDVCWVRGCGHRSPPLWENPTTWQLKNWEALRQHPSLLFVETWPDIVHDAEPTPATTPGRGIEPPPLEELPWRRWVTLDPNDVVVPLRRLFHRSECRIIRRERESALMLEEAARRPGVPCSRCFVLRDPIPTDPGDELDEYGFSSGKPWSRNR
jgi:hypothetical protein